MVDRIDADRLRRRVPRGARARRRRPDEPDARRARPRLQCGAILRVRVPRTTSSSRSPGSCTTSPTRSRPTTTPTTTGGAPTSCGRSSATASRSSSVRTCSRSVTSSPPSPSTGRALSDRSVETLARAGRHPRHDASSTLLAGRSRLRRDPRAAPGRRARQGPGAASVPASTSWRADLAAARGADPPDALNGRGRRSSRRRSASRQTPSARDRRLDPCA